jgi:segregation and condensation protein A
MQERSTAAAQANADLSGSATAAMGVKPSVSPYAVRLDFFSGPMDLLLHLVHEQEVPIEKVQMSIVAEQYLEILTRNAQYLDLEKASEYLVIAATLLAIKSSSLLPSAIVDGDNGETPDEWVDHRFFEDLRQRLRAYELTKSRAMALVKSPQMGVDTFVRIDRKALQPTPEMMAAPEEAYALGVLFGKLLKRIGLTGASLRIALEPVSVVSFMMKIVDALTPGASLCPSSDSADAEPAGGTCCRKSLGQMLFSFVPESMRKRLCAEKGSPVHRREIRCTVIGGFVAVLELVKRGVVSISESAEGLNVGLQMRMDSAGDDIFSSEFDNSFGETQEKQEEAGDIAAQRGTQKVVNIADYRAASQGIEAEPARADDAQEDSGMPVRREAGNV